MKYLKKSAAVLVAAVLLLTACSGGDMSWSFKSGQTQTSPGLYILYQISAFGEAEEKIAEGIPDYAGMEPNELLKQTVEGKPASDWIQERAVELVKEHITVQEKFASYGLSFSGGELASIESSLGEANKNAGDFYEKNGISEETLREYYTGYLRKTRLFTAFYGDGGELAPSGDELKEYINKNYAMIDTLLIFKTLTVPEGETKTLEQLTSEEEAMAEGFLERLRSGEEIEQLSYEWSLSQAGEEEKAGITKPEKGQLSMVVSESMRASYGDEFTDKAMGARIGDSEMVDDGNMFIIFKKADITESPDFSAYKTIALQEMKGGEFDSKLAEWAAAVPLETNNAVIAKYKPEKLKLT